MWSYISLATFVIFLIYAGVSAVISRIQKNQWRKLTGRSWPSTEQSEYHQREEALMEIAKSGDRERFEKARRLAIKLDNGSTSAAKFASARNEIRDFDHYFSL